MGLKSICNNDMGTKHVTKIPFWGAGATQSSHWTPDSVSSKVVSEWQDDLSKMVNRRLHDGKVKKRLRTASGPRKLPLEAFQKLD